MAGLARFDLPQDRWPTQFIDLVLPWASFLAVAALLGACAKGLPGFFALFLALLVGPQYLLALIYPGGRVSLSNPPAGFLSTVGLAAAALLLVQYSTRRRALVALLGLAALPLAWMRPISWRPGPKPGFEAGPALGRFHLELSPGPGRETFAVRRAAARFPHHAAELQCLPGSSDVPGDLVVYLNARPGAIQWADGGATRFALSAWLGAEPGPVFPGFAWAEGHAPRTAWQSLWLMGGEPPQRFLGRRGRLQGTARGSAWRAQAVPLELRPGARIAQGSFAARVLDVRTEPFEMRVRIRDLTARRGMFVRRQHFLVNPARREIVGLEASDSADRSGSLGLLFGGPWIGAQEEVWSIRGAEPPPPGWLAGAEARIVLHDFAGSLEVELEAPAIAVDEVVAKPVYENQVEGLEPQQFELSVSR